MELRTERLILRPFRDGDEDELAAAADDVRVWIHLRDRFPHPYTVVDAAQWIAHVRPEVPARNLAVTLEGRVIGGVGVERLGDVARFTAELGYWLDPRYWGRGFASEAVPAFVEWAFETFPFERIQAWVFTPNAASRRVLERCGFRLEGLARRSVFKDGRFLDSQLYARIRGEA